MFRTLTLALFAASLGACAAAPQSDTDSLVDDVVRDRSTRLHCQAKTYCVVSGGRISSDRNEQCSCNPPAALFGMPITR